jgi:hypothetical protein
MNLNPICDPSKRTLIYIIHLIETGSHVYVQLESTDKLVRKSVVTAIEIRHVGIGSISVFLDFVLVLEYVTGNPKTAVVVLSFPLHLKKAGSLLILARPKSFKPKGLVFNEHEGFASLVVSRVHDETEWAGTSNARVVSLDCIADKVC